MKCPTCNSEVEHISFRHKQWDEVRCDRLRDELDSAIVILRRHAKQVDLSRLLEADIPKPSDCAVVYESAH